MCNLVACAPPLRRRSTRNNARARSFARDGGTKQGSSLSDNQPRRYTENARDSARLRGAKSFFLRRSCTGASGVGVGATTSSSSARSLSPWESIPAAAPGPAPPPAHIPERTEADARATFARSRNRALRDAGGSTDALDAFGPALARVHDSRALARALHALHAALPRDVPAAALHADSLARAAALADAGIIPESPNLRQGTRPRAPTLGNIEAAAPFGDTLALAAVAAAACGRIGVRRAVRRDSTGWLRATLTIRTGKVVARLEVAEHGDERVSVAVVPNSAWPWSPSRRNAFDSLLKTFRIEWHALGVDAPPPPAPKQQAESQSSSSSRALGNGLPRRHSRFNPLIHIASTAGVCYGPRGIHRNAR